jgi:DNA-binding transcriptional MerR regulator
MPIIIKGKTYYRTSEACIIAGIGRSTLLRWIRKNSQHDASHRDKRGWRLFTEDDVRRIEKEANRITWGQPG